MDFRGSVVAVTGAAKGLGRDMALRFASLGARLALCDIDGESLAATRDETERRGSEVLTDIVDVAQAWQMEEFRDSVVRRFGHTDVLVNNAGVALAGGLEQVDADDIRWIFGVNLWGVIHGCHFFYPAMKERGSGHIVNISSAAALGPLPALSAYCATKSAVLALSEHLRAEAAPHGVGVSAVCPGFISSDITRGMRFRGRTRRTDSGKWAGNLDRFFQRINKPPARVTDAVVSAVERDRAVVLVGPETYITDAGPRVSRAMSDFLLKRGVEVMERFM